MPNAYQSSPAFGSAIVQASMIAGIQNLPDKILVHGYSGMIDIRSAPNEIAPAEILPKTETLIDTFRGDIQNGMDVEIDISDFTYRGFVSPLLVGGIDWRRPKDDEPGKTWVRIPRLGNRRNSLWYFDASLVDAHQGIFDYFSEALRMKDNPRFIQTPSGYLARDAVSIVRVGRASLQIEDAEGALMTVLPVEGGDGPTSEPVTTAFNNFAKDAKAFGPRELVSLVDFGLMAMAVPTAVGMIDETPKGVRVLNRNNKLIGFVAATDADKRRQLRADIAKAFGLTVAS